MPVQLSVGPPVITISQDLTFVVTDLKGEISEESEQGIFASDTRFVSHYRIFANDVPWTLLTASAVAYNTARYYLTNQAVVTEEGEIPAGTLSLAITRVVVPYGVVEHLEVSNYNLRPVRFNLELELRGDFADLFEVKSNRHTHRGNIDSTIDLARGKGAFTYVNGDFQRSLVYHPLTNDTKPRFVNGRVAFGIHLSPAGSWSSAYRFDLTGGETRHPVPASPSSAPTANDIERLQNEWRGIATRLVSSNEDVRRAFQQSVEDMGALRLYAYDLGPNAWVPAAGVPWFVTLFGRDSLVVSLQNMLVDPSFARGALWALAQFQATTADDWRDAQPGKILHELRFGELAHFHKIPHTPYYGTWDATPLYLITLHEAWKWTGDDTLLRSYYDVAVRGLDWIDRYGDIDGDGFQEYKTYSTKGYENMGWKDAGDAVVYPDGSQVKQPKALCELQGYVFDAWLRMAEVFEQLGENDRAAELRRKAAELQQRFEQQFWCDDLGFYAYGLDPDKTPIKTIASNPGHCLWSGIATPEHAAKVVQRFFEPDMSSGWGIRTLSTRNPAYNPFSYQNGSVWPHDNGIAAMGFARYGFAAEAARVAHDIFDAASRFVSYRLPELYAGVARDRGTFPVQYLGANVPQAWAAGCLFHFVRALLGLQADAPRNTLGVDPHLPDWLPDVTLTKLKVGESQLDLRFWREGKTTRWEILAQAGNVKVAQKPWGPWVIGTRQKQMDADKAA